MDKVMFKRVVKESVPALVVAAILGMAAGAMMQLKLEMWASLPIFLMLVPPLNDLGNDISCIVSSKISTLLALGIIKPEMRINAVLKENLVSISIVAFLSALYLGAINYMIAGGAGVETISVWSFLAICIVAVSLLTLLVVTISISVAFVSWRKGLDPDNVTIPICTSVSDVLGIVCLLIAVAIIGVG